MRTKAYLQRIPDLKGKTYIITGANSGLGFALSELLIQKNAHVIMANRNTKKSQSAIEKLKNKYPFAEISLYIYDQSKRESINKFVDIIAKEKIQFDGVIFNAGVYLPSKKAVTSEGYAQTFGVNFVGNYYLAKALSESGLVSNSTRFVFTTSPAAKRRFNASVLQKLVKGKLSRHNQYTFSKTAINIFASGLMTGNESIPFNFPGIVSVYHPGVANSNIARFKFIPFNVVAHGFMKVVFHSPYKAVLGALLALTSQDDMNGKMIVPRGPFEVIGIPRVKKIDASLLKHLNILINKIK